MGPAEEACVDQKESYVSAEGAMGAGVGTGVAGMGAAGADAEVGTGGWDVTVGLCGVGAGMG